MDHAPRSTGRGPTARKFLETFTYTHISVDTDRRNVDIIIHGQVRRGIFAVSTATPVYKVGGGIARWLLKVDASPQYTQYIGRPVCSECV